MHNSPLKNLGRKSLNMKLLGLGGFLNQWRCLREWVRILESAPMLLALLMYSLLVLQWVRGRRASRFMVMLFGVGCLRMCSWVMLWLICMQSVAWQRRQTRFLSEWRLKMWFLGMLWLLDILRLVDLMMLWVSSWRFGRRRLSSM